MTITLKNIGRETLVLQLPPNVGGVEHVHVGTMRTVRSRSISGEPTDLRQRNTVGFPSSITLRPGEEADLPSAAKTAQIEQLLRAGKLRERAGASPAPVASPEPPPELTPEPEPEPVKSGRRRRA